MELEVISAPSLESSEYGKNVSEVFNKINTNFSTIVSAIDNINLTNELISLKNNDKFENLTNSIKNTLQKVFNTNKITTEILTSNIGEINIIKDTKDNYLYFTPVIYIDKEYLNSPNINSVDTTCEISGLYNEYGEWQITINKNIPRIYWNTDIKGYCWIINDIKTEISAQGIRGPKGESSSVTALQTVEVASLAEISETNNTYYIGKVLRYLNNNGEYTSDLDNLLIGSPAITTYTENTDNEETNIYSGYIYLTSDGGSQSYKSFKGIKMAFINNITDSDIENIWNEVMNTETNN